MAACGEYLPHPPYSPQATSALASLEFAPPPGRVEKVPPKPPQADAWIDGEWLLRRRRWYWRLGYWVKTPPGATFSPWVVVRASDGILWYAEGGWHDRRGMSIVPPPALAAATASNEAVVDPEGRTEDTGRNIKTAPPARRTTQERH
jgi:hypothetical protein